MPELPEVEVTRLSFAERIAGAQIVGVRFGMPLLRQVPGVFTNTTRGEIYNGVVVRGMVLGEAYYYVSMQEDGLPIIPAAGQFSPDAFLRADVSIGRIEAVRGGTASILGVK